MYISYDKERNTFNVRWREGVGREGKLCRDKLFWDNRTDANKRIKELERQTKNNALGIYREITFREAFAIFLKHTLPRLTNDLQRAHCETYVAQILESFAEMRLNDTTYQHILDYWESFIKRGCKASTANRSIMWLHNLYERMKIWNAMVPEMMPEKVKLPEINPVHVAKDVLKKSRRSSEKPFKRKRILSDVERQAAHRWCIEHNEPQLWEAIKMAMLTMLRKSDLLRMKANQVIEGTQEKTQRSFYVPLLMPVTVTLSAREIRTRWDNMRADLGWGTPGTPLHVTWHDLRHCGPSYLAGMGVPMPIIQALLGHSSPEQSSTYVNIEDHILRPAVELLYQKLEAV